MPTGETRAATRQRQGGCLCGAVRYALASMPTDIGYCHCRLCQRAAGAPVLVWASVALADFAVVQGSPRRRRSSAFGERWFCADCGTQLAMRVDDEPDTIDVTVASLDEPAAAPPDFHIFAADRLAWFETRDDLPRFGQSRVR